MSLPKDILSKFDTLVPFSEMKITDTGGTFLQKHTQKEIDTRKEKKEYKKNNRSTSTFNNYKHN